MVYKEHLWDLPCADQEKLRNAIIDAREERGLTQEVVAEESGYSLAQYVCLENGERIITREDVMIVGAVFVEYDDSLKSPFERKLSKITSYFKQSLYDLQESLEKSAPETKNIFRIVSLHKIALWFFIILILKLTDGAYNIGFLIGKLARLTENALPSFLPF